MHRTVSFTGSPRRKARQNVSNYATYTLASSGLLWSANASADFSGPYALTPPSVGTYTPPQALGAWMASFVDDAEATTTPAVDTTGAPASVVLSLASTANSFLSANRDTLSLWTTCVADGVLNFAFSFSPDGVTAESDAAFLLNGNPTALVGVGTFSQMVNAGDLFGFQLRDGSAYLMGTGITSLTLSDFRVEAVPESSSLSALAAGFLGLLGWREVRRRRAVSPLPA